MTCLPVLYFFCLFVYLFCIFFVYLFICFLFICFLFICFVFICLFVYLFICLFVYLFCVYLFFVYLFICFFVYLFFCLFVFLFICLFLENQIKLHQTSSNFIKLLLNKVVSNPNIGLIFLVLFVLVRCEHLVCILIIHLESLPYHVHLYFLVVHYIPPQI